MMKPARKSYLGEGKDIFLTEPLDIWIPEARGYSSRVFLGFLKNEHKLLKQAAVKIMRPDKVEYAIPLFEEEARILSELRNVPGVVRIHEFGFVKLDKGNQIPSDDDNFSARELNGEVIRIIPDHVTKFIKGLRNFVRKGWLPYIALEKIGFEENLLLLCDSGYTKGKYLPVKDGIEIAVQICNLLSIVHKRNIEYRDHKIIHYYWNSYKKNIVLIDWNVAQSHSRPLLDAEKRFDLVQMGARILHYIFTGRSASGSLAIGPTSPNEILRSPKEYSLQWTYDDKQRLPESLQGLLLDVVAGIYCDADHLANNLLCISQEINKERG